MASGDNGALGNDGFEATGLEPLSPSWLAGLLLGSFATVRGYTERC